MQILEPVFELSGELSLPPAFKQYSTRMSNTLYLFIQPSVSGFQLSAEHFNLNVL